MNEQCPDKRIQNAVVKLSKESVTIDKHLIYVLLDSIYEAIDTCDSKGEWIFEFNYYKYPMINNMLILKQVLVCWVIKCKI